MTVKKLLTRFLTGLMFHFALAFLLCSATIAQQLEPNPNPEGNTITVNTSAHNSEYFENFGTIDNFGDINNSGTIYNYYHSAFVEGIINNSGTIDNSGIIDNSDTIENWHTINNWGIIYNSPLGIIYNSPYGTIDNDGNIYNSGNIHNTGTIYNTGLGTIDNDGTIDNFMDIFNWGTIDNEGIIDNERIIGNWGTIGNSGMIDNWNFLSNWGDINNTGFIQNCSTIANSFGGTIDNSGTIRNWFTIGNSGTINNRLGGTIDNSGTINNLTTGTIDNSGSINNTLGTFNNQGTLKGTGTFIGDLLTDSGTVAPGSSAGTMFVDGDFILAGSGILDIEIGGFTPGSFDVLDITGTAFLPGGNINFSFLDVYDIVADVGPGESWELSFLKAGSIDSFNSVINYNFMSLPYFQFNVFQQGNELVFEATNLVPLPGAVILGSLGLTFSGWLLRRRKML